ncbi:Thioredoxin [Rubripirellula obstinata]|uniref:Thioredoxin n=1 Tax=Rubripirellula obstinata TaxID=406547 RepID=A0A5B1CEW5_9BACT|nr:trypsin-like peptidase domain-containing protein [Rubripirellula obstinata]KAA1258771.1 Thioredoxin [Rubripirellula obstinata]
MRSSMMIGMATGLLAAVCVMSSASASDAILINFTSPHCGPCQTMKPTLAALERTGIPVRHVNVNSEASLARRYGIRKTPTFVVVSGGKELTRLVGIQSVAQLQRALGTNPSGPLVPTGAKSRAIDNIPAPMTRLAPMGRGRTNLDFESRSPAQNSQRNSQQNSQRNSNTQTLTAARPDRSAAPSEVMPSLSIASAVQRAEAATVRLRVHDGRGYGAGTGTIIDVHGDEALVLTCGHLFRENEGQGRIEVDLFVGGETRTVEGKVLDYDADDRDIALVTIRPGFDVQPVPVILDGQKPRTGQAVFSFGCDRGDDPTRRDTRITGVDKYNQHLGISNIEIGGAPIDGRSGGGLFDETGRLIGVCNAADYKNDVGIYAGPGNVHWQLDRVNMASLYQNDRSNDFAVAANEPAPAMEAPVRLASNQAFNEPPASNQLASNQEVIVIVRDRSNPDGSPEVMTVRQPSDALMQMIHQHAR